MMRRTRRHLAGRRCMVRRPTATHFENFDANNARGRAGSCRKLLGWSSSHQLERSHSASIWPQTGPLCAGGARQARRRLLRLLFLLRCSFLPVPSCFDPSPVAGAALPFAPSSHLTLMRTGPPEGRMHTLARACHNPGHATLILFVLRERRVRVPCCRSSARGDVHTARGQQASPPGHC